MYFGEYIPVAKKKENALKLIKKLKKKNEDIKPVEILGKKLVNTWWGISWNKNLERYSDFSNRVGRGRSYVRHGAVVDLKIEKGTIKSLVLGSSKKPYSINISIEPMDIEKWENIKLSCGGRFDSFQELIEGKFPKSLKEVFFEENKGLFPRPKEIKFSCSCPDYAYMCKHVAATLYGIGTRLDEDPKLFFALRNINIEDIIKKDIDRSYKNLMKSANKKSNRVIIDEDFSNMFEIDLE